jgi:hypothetical protein
VILASKSGGFIIGENIFVDYRTTLVMGMREC